MVHYIGKVGDDGPMPETATSSEIQGGEQMTFTLSAGNPVWEIDPTPDFQGFLVIMCEFQFAHGYAFITDGAAGIPTLAQGYLALVLQFDGLGNRLINCNGFGGGKGKGGPMGRGGFFGIGCPSEGLNH